MPICPYCKKETSFSQTSLSMFKCTECSTEYLDSYFFSLPREIAVLPKPVPVVRQGLAIPSKAQISLDEEAATLDCLNETEESNGFPNFPALDNHDPFMASSYDILRWYDYQFGLLDHFSCITILASILHLSCTEISDIVKNERINVNRKDSMYIPRYSSLDMMAALFQNFLSKDEIQNLPAKCHKNNNPSDEYNFLAIIAYIEKVLGRVEYQTVKYSYLSPTGKYRLRLA